MQILEPASQPALSMQVRCIIGRLRREWLGPDYELLTNNCLHFCDELAEALQVPKVPGAERLLRTSAIISPLGLHELKHMLFWNAPCRL